MYIESKTKNAIACLGKKPAFQFFIRKVAIISIKLRIFTFKNRSISSGRGVVQTEPNMACVIIVIRV